MIIISDAVNGRKLRRDCEIARKFERDGVIKTPWRDLRENTEVYFIGEVKF